MPQYPTAPVKFIVGSPAGGGVDRVTRILCAQLGQRLGQAFAVENVTGTSAMIGSTKAAHAAPDGHTLLMVSSQFSVLPSLYDDMPYDTLNDFVPLAQVATSPLILIVPASLPVNSIGELRSLAKARKLTYANVGNGGAPHLAAESFFSEAGVAPEGVLYEGIVPAISGILEGKVDMLFASLPSVLAHLKAKRMKGLAVTTKKRAAELPDTPTIAESGVPNYEYGAWFGALAPAGTPSDVIAILGREIAESLRQPQAQAQLRELGYEPVGTTPQQFAVFLRSEMTRWAKVVKAAGIRAI